MVFVYLLALLTSVTLTDKASAQDGKHYRIVTGPAGSQAYAIGVGVTSLVKLNIMPKSGVDLNPLATSGLLESFDLLSKGEADFALLNAVWSDLVATDGGAQAGGIFGQEIQSVATLWREGDRSTQLVARRDVDQAVVYDIVKTIFENLYFLENVDKSMAEASLDRATEEMNLPLHEGARRYFLENEALADVEAIDAAIASPVDPKGEQTAPSPAFGDGDKKTFVLFFDFDEATITVEGDAVLDDLEALGPELNTSTVWIAGYTDTTGLPEYNLQLGQRRVDAVMANLRARDVESRDVYAAAFGERAPWIKTPDEANEARNRRVEIFVEPHHDAAVVAEQEDPVVVESKIEPASAPSTIDAGVATRRQPTF